MAIGIYVHLLDAAGALPAGEPPGNRRTIEIQIPFNAPAGGETTILVDDGAISPAAAARSFACPPVISTHSRAMHFRERFSASNPSSGVSMTPF